MRKRQDENKDGFGNWPGSLLTFPLLNWPQHVILMYHPASTVFGRISAQALFAFREHWTQRIPACVCPPGNVAPPPS
jgi:hypothetical protein